MSTEKKPALGAHKSEHRPFRLNLSAKRHGSDREHTDPPGLRPLVGTARPEPDPPLRRGKKGKRAQGKGLTQRAPKRALRVDGVWLLRPADRMLTAPTLKLPPRSTRVEPVSTQALPSAGAPV